MKLCLVVALVGLWCVKDSVQDPSQKLNVTLYYEALCPYCVQLITKQLYPAYQKIGSSLQLDIVPYGNALRTQVDGKWKYECQHGPPECAINKLEACGLANTDNQDKQMEFLNCVESKDYQADEKSRAVACATSLGLTADQLLQCSNGPEGEAIFSKLADRTEAVRELIRGVPAVFFNDKFDAQRESSIDFLGVACKLLNPQPSGCKT